MSLYTGDPQDRQYLASQLATWFLKQVDEESTQYRLLPKATKQSGINVIDEVTGACIIKLSMEKKELSDGEFADMQNRFWTVVAHQIKSSAEMRRELEDCGIKVEPPMEDVT